MRVLLVGVVAIALTGRAAATDFVEFPCKCEGGNLAEGNRDDGVCIRLNLVRPEKGIRPNIDKATCESFYEPGNKAPFYFCCVDSQDRPVTPPPEFVPDKMKAWFAMTEKFGCDPCEKARPNRNKQCLYYKDRRTDKKPDKSPKVKWQKNLDEEECDALAADDVKVETYWCGEPPKDGECTPTPVPTAAKTYSYNFETMQPTLSPTPQATPP